MKCPSRERGWEEGQEFSLMRDIQRGSTRQWVNHVLSRKRKPQGGMLISLSHMNKGQPP